MQLPKPILLVITDSNIKLKVDVFKYYSQMFNLITSLVKLILTLTITQMIGKNKLLADARCLQLLELVLIFYFQLNSTWLDLLQ